MSDPVKIIVTADTAQAAAALRSFVTQAGGGLNEIEAAAKSANIHIAGMSYYFRSGIDAIRLAAVGGGARAGFYAVDEAIRGLISSGMGLTTLLPIIGGVGAAVGGLAFAWHEWGNEAGQAAEHAKALADALEKIPKILDQINAAQQAGRLGAGQAGSLQDILAGRTPMFRKTGSFDPATGHWDLVPEARSRITTGRMRGNYRDNAPADAADLAYYADQALKSGGATLANGNDDPQITATNRLNELMHRVSEESLQGTAKELAAAADKHQKDLDELKNFADKAKLTAQQVADRKAQIDAAYAAKKVEIEDKANADVQTSYEAYLQEDAAVEKQIAEERKKEKQEELDRVVEQQREMRRVLTMEQKTTLRDSPAVQWGAVVSQLQLVNNLARESAELFGHVFNAAITTVSGNLTRVIEGCETMHKALQNIARTIVGDIINGILEMGFRWIATQLMMFTFGKSLQAAATAALIPIAAAQAGIWWAPAVLSTIASYGTAAASAPPEILAAIGGFKDGGYTGGGPVDQVAGVVHGGEYVVPAHAVDRIGVEALNSLSQGAGGGASGPAAGASAPQVHIVVVNDHKAAAEYVKSIGGERAVLAHVANNKLRLGIKT